MFKPFKFALCAALLASLALGCSDSDNGDNETHECAVCGITGSHNLINNGTDGHSCPECGYSEGHVLNKVLDGHPNCLRCSYVEPHNWVESGGNHICTVCNESHTPVWVMDPDDSASHVCSVCHDIYELHHMENGVCTICGYTQ